MVTKKACKYVDIALAGTSLHDDTAHFTNNIDELEFTVEGKYKVNLYADDRVHVKTKNKHLKKHGLHPSLVQVFRRLGVESDDVGDNSDAHNRSHQFSGYTRATVVENSGQKTTYNAHPYFHGPWYDWAYVYYEIEEEFGSVSKYYPLTILGFVKDCDDEVHTIIMCSCEPLLWRQLEENFVTKFKLCSKAGEEQVPYI
jgi:hypothetical protein